MYHAVVRAKVRKLWTRVAAGDYRAAVAMAAPTLRFRFVGEAPPAATLTGPVEFERWFADLFVLFPGIRVSLADVVVRGWPWRTTVIVRLSIEATLADGTPYRNEGIQWVTLRWGRMVEDYVLEDTARLYAAVRLQQGCGIGQRP
ncbi:nuclear transport factor 2 family protein [Solihabitans fulvus]|uniref:Nuclear transport factor 2 family protein n=1 Tax=Solihabitans fulvus TaxID=1892852 RepID=A0A5B2WNN8_9PSEU|nr:nuclear transport factor 2 family protein [Solihabitans fulvus]KAA2252410.1 nuclear transport factor 2 family protein [Solihabitans fulvus]